MLSGPGDLAGFNLEKVSVENVPSSTAALYAPLHFRPWKVKGGRKENAVTPHHGPIYFQ